MLVKEHVRVRVRVARSGIKLALFHHDDDSDADADADADAGNQQIHLERSLLKLKARVLHLFFVNSKLKQQVRVRNDLAFKFWRKMRLKWAFQVLMALARSERSELERAIAQLRFEMAVTCEKTQKHGSQEHKEAFDGLQKVLSRRSLLALKNHSTRRLLARGCLLCKDSMNRWKQFVQRMKGFKNSCLERKNKTLLHEFFEQWVKNTKISPRLLNLMDIQHEKQRNRKMKQVLRKLRHNVVNERVRDLLRKKRKFMILKRCFRNWKTHISKFELLYHLGDQHATTNRKRKAFDWLQRFSELSKRKGRVKAKIERLLLGRIFTRWREAVFSRFIEEFAHNRFCKRAKRKSLIALQTNVIKRLREMKAFQRASGALILLQKRRTLKKLRNVSHRSLKERWTAFSFFILSSERKNQTAFQKLRERAIVQKEKNSRITEANEVISAHNARKVFVKLKNLKAAKVLERKANKFHSEAVTKRILLNWRLEVRVNRPKLEILMKWNTERIFLAWRRWVIRKKMKLGAARLLLDRIERVRLRKAFQNLKYNFALAIMIEASQDFRRAKALEKTFHDWQETALALRLERANSVLSTFFWAKATLRKHFKAWRWATGFENLSKCARDFRLIQILEWSFFQWKHACMKRRNEITVQL